MANHSYYCVEHSFVVRYDKDGDSCYQRYLESGKWEPYHDSWDVITNGRWIATEEEAMKTAQRLFDDERRWRAEGKV